MVRPALNAKKAKPCRAATVPALLPAHLQFPTSQIASCSRFGLPLGKLRNGGDPGCLSLFKFFGATWISGLRRSPADRPSAAVHLAAGPGSLGALVSGSAQEVWSAAALRSCLRPAQDDACKHKSDHHSQARNNPRHIVSFTGCHSALQLQVAF